MTAISPGAASTIAEFGDEPGSALLRHDQHFAIGIIKVAVGHRAVGGINMNRDADLRRDVAIAAERNNAFDKVSRLCREWASGLQRSWVGVASASLNGALRIVAIVDARIGAVHDRGLNAIGPGPAIVVARGGK